MISYSLKPNASSNSVDWHDSTVWAGGVVPNAPDADVDFPIVTQNSTGEPYISSISILDGEGFAIRSLALRDYLSVYGSLSVSGTLTQSDAGEIDMNGGTLSAGAIIDGAYDIQGDGHIIVGTLTNNSLTIGGALTIDVTTLVNAGTLAASSGTTTINVGAGGLSGFAGGTLGNGTLEAYPGATLALDAGSIIATDAGTIILAGGSTGQDMSLTSSLHAIAAGGSLSVTSGTYHFGQLTAAGTLSLSDAAQFTADQLIIAPGGHLTGSGTLSSAVENDGVIQVGSYLQGGAPGYGGTLVLGGAVTGSGSIEILPAHGYDQIHVGYVYSGATLEIAGPIAQNILFDDAYEILRLDEPTGLTGSITVATAISDFYNSYSDKIFLPNVDFNSIVGESYAGSAAGGRRPAAR